MDVNKLSRIQKQLLMLIADMFSLFSAIWLGFSLRLGELYSLNIELIKILLLASVITVPVFIRLGLYKAIIRYVGIKALWSVLQAVAVSVLLWGVIILYADFNMPRTVPLIASVILLMFVGGSRILARSLFSKKTNKFVNDSKQKNVLIYGAGEAGVQLAKAFEYDACVSVKGFIDDDKNLQGKYILGLEVHEFSDGIKKFNLSEKKSIKINEILLAIPSVSRAKRSSIIAKLEPFPIKIRTLPRLSELAQGKINADSVQEINIADLLGREAVSPNQSLLSINVKNKAILVTGAGGSIGSELCRQIINLDPSILILFEQSELALYQIEKELLNLQKSIGVQIDILPVLGSVVDQNRVERVCRRFKIQTIYHAAAYKHVPMVEKNISEGIRNNIFGTFNCAQAAINTKVETFVLISTDKAVRPTNTMGATKRFSELILQGLSQPDQQQQTRFVMVRFGNVLGSSGSVIPLFKEQIHKGGQLTVTDPNIIRYFMTIPEAAQLVIQAGAMGEGGDVFVLDMGEPIKILELAKRMIKLSGYEVKDKDTPNGDIEIVFTGLRPGEKLYEELLIGNNVTATKHKLIRRAEEDFLSWREITGFMFDMKKALAKENEKALRHILEKAVDGYKSQCEVVDVLYEKTRASLSVNNNKPLDFFKRVI